jgi:tetratricopeptide (TPR) repeat protein
MHLGSFLFVFSSAGFAGSDFSDLIKKGVAAYSAFQIDAAQNYYEQACASGLNATFPPEQTALCEHEFGTIAETHGLQKEAENHYLAALAGWDKLGIGYVGHHTTTLTNLGGLYRRQHRLAEAEKLFSEAIEYARKVQTADPELYATVLSRSGGLYGDLDQPERGRRMLNEAIAGLRALTRPNAPEVAYAYSSLGMLELGSGRYKSGESNLREAVSCASASLGENHPETAAYETNLALALLIQGEFVRAETLLRRARFVIESRLGPDTYQLVNVLSELATVETGLGKFGLAEEYAEKALSNLSAHVPAGSLDIALAQVNLAGLYLRERKTAAAEKILPPAIETERQVLRSGRTLADGIRNLGRLRVQQHAWSDAETLYRDAIGFYNVKLGPDHPDLAPVLREYAGVLKHQGAPRAQLKDLEARARSIQNSGQRASTPPTSASTT